MEIVNNKDGVPFEHYLRQYRELDPHEISKRCGVGYDGNSFRFRLMGQDARFTFPGGELIDADKLHISPKEVGPTKILIIRFLISGRLETSTGNFIAYRDMPWGEVYDANFQGRCIKRTAFTFGTKPRDFEKAMEKAGAQRGSKGDIEYTVAFIDGLFMCFIIWEADDEFPPSAQILFSDNFSAAFTAEDMAVIGDVSIDILRNMAKEDS